MGFSSYYILKNRKTFALIIGGLLTGGLIVFLTLVEKKEVTMKPSTIKINFLPPEAPKPLKKELVPAKEVTPTLPVKKNPSRVDKEQVETAVKALSKAEKEPVESVEKSSFKEEKEPVESVEKALSKVEEKPVESVEKSISKVEKDTPESNKSLPEVKDEVVETAKEISKYTKIEMLSGNSITPDPKYPRSAIKWKLQGIVELEFIINKKGDIVEIDIIKSSGHKILDKECLKTIRGEWKFSPQDGSKTIFKRFIFNLE